MKICDPTLLANLRYRLVAETGKSTIEQVNSACMRGVWEMRASWNRNEIIREICEVLRRRIAMLGREEVLETEVLGLASWVGLG